MANRIADRYFWPILAILFTLALAKHGLTFATGSPALEYDALDYWQRGVRIAEGDLFQYQQAVSYRGPVYPLFLGTMRWLFQDRALMLVAAVQHLMQIGTGLLTAFLVWRTTANRLAVAVAYATSVSCVTQPWFANLVLTESMFMFAMTAVMACLMQWTSQPSRRWATAFGVMYGVAMLVRPIPKLLWVPLLFVVICEAIRRAAVREVRKDILAGSLACLAIIMPWALRNFLIFNTASVASVPPINKWVVCFHDGSCADLPIPITPEGNYLRQIIPAIDSDKSQRNGYRVIDQLRASGLTDAETDRLISKVCLDALLQNPDRFCTQFARRCINFWRTPVKPYPFYSDYVPGLSTNTRIQRQWRCPDIAGVYEQLLLRHAPSSTLLWVEFESLLCGLGTLVLICRRDSRPVGMILALTFLYFMLVTSALEVENVRYRLILDPCMIWATVCGLFHRRHAVPCEASLPSV